MTVLTDKKINEYIKEGKLKIIPFEKNAVTTNGYDMLTEDFTIKPGEFMLVRSREKIEMPDDVTAVPFLRTTYAFKGLILSPGIMDAGYKGFLRFAIYNASKEIVTLKNKEETKRAIHILFLKTDGKTEIPFGGRKGEKNNIL
ncbi:MAG: hypothetical protein PHH00_03895 [Candidatus Nanoarchaeia archaeon]|nr:hypothetical protein [Candidatus Nanoarchaeia archaeon]